MTRITSLALSLLFFATAFSQAPVDFYGVTGIAGPDNIGAIFKSDGQGGNIEVRPFEKYGERTSVYCTPIEPVTGLLYGMTSLGGENDEGVIYEYDIINEAYQIRHSFSAAETGKNPNGSLVKASNGKLYGMTKNGGDLDKGVIFEYDLITHEVLKLHDFNGVNGEFPLGSLIQSSDGMLYGMTSAGGVNGKGIIFRYDIGIDSLEKLMDFDGTATGSTPRGDLLEADNGLMYGFTQMGGASNYGVMFSFDKFTLGYVNVMNMTYTTRYPAGSFIQATNGLLYGITRGQLIQYNTATSTNDPAYGEGDGTPFESPYGEIYWLSKTTTGTFSEIGALWKFSSGFTDDYAHFTNSTVGNNFSAGVSPCNSMIYASDGKYYGVTGDGSWGSGGAIYTYPGYGNAVAGVVAFNTQSTVGKSSSDLVEVDKKLYGIGSGGRYNDGTIYRYDVETDSIEVMVEVHVPLINGIGTSELDQSFVLHPNGKLYTGFYGGASYSGFLMEYVPGEHTYTNRHDFVGNLNGHAFKIRLIVGQDGLIYGVTNHGGANDYGVLFSFNVYSGDFITLHDYTYYDQSPYRLEVTQTQDGKLYGISPGDVNGAPGVIYSYDLVTNTYDELYTLNEVSGPMGPLVEGEDGNLYVSFTYGGENGLGVLARYNRTSNTLETLYSFVDDQTGTHPGKIILGTNGKIYGLASWYQNSQLFEFDPATNAFQVQNELDSYTEAGFTGYYGLSKLCRYITETSTIDTVEICPLTTFEYTATATGDSLHYQWMKDFTELPDQTEMTLSIENISPADTGVYYCLVSNGCRELYSDSVVLIVLPQPVIDAGTDQHICNDSLTTLTATGDALTYIWSDGILNEDPFVVTENAEYVLSGVNEFGCFNYDTVEVLLTPVVNAGPDTTVCYMTSAAFFGSGDAVSYVWNDTIADGEPFVITETQAVVVTGFNAEGCPYSDTLTVFMDTCQVVWPGDTDDDAEVGIQDFFNIGLNYGQLGEPRNEITSVWEPQPAPFWDSVMSAGTGIGLNMAYADCNGDGTVDENDTLAVYNNFALVHAGKPTPEEAENLDETGGIYFSSTATEYGANQLVTIDILAGSSALSLEDIYGLGFDVNYTATGIVPGSLRIQMNDQSWLGEVNTNAIRLGVNEDDDENAHLALCRTDHTNVSGFGIIGRVTFLTSTLEGEVELSVSNAMSVDAGGLLTDLETDVYSVTIDPVLAVSDNASQLNCTVFPNPSKGLFNVAGLRSELVYTIVLRDMTGKVLREMKISNQAAAQLEADLSAGSYLMEITTGSSVYREQVIVTGK